MKLLNKHVRRGECAGWQELYLIDQGTIQNKTMGGGSLTDGLYCGVNVPKSEQDISD